MRPASGVVIFCFAFAWLSTVCLGHTPTVSKVAVTGDAVSGELDLRYRSFADPVINESGQCLFRATVDGAGVTVGNDTVIASKMAGSLGLVAREAQLAPGAGTGVRFHSFGGWRISESGEIGVQAALNNGRTGIWSRSAAALQPVAIAGQQAPGLSPGVSFASLESYAWSASPGGQHAFYADLTGPGVTDANAVSIWFCGDAGLTLAARTGDHAAGRAGGITFQSFYYPVASANGEVAFYAGLSGPGLGALASGIWRGEPGSLQPIMSAGDSVPGLPGAVFSSADPFFKTNGAGQIAMVTSIAGPGVDTSNLDVIVSGDPDALSIVARKGSSAPGIESGVTFGRLESPSLDLAGDVAFTAGLRGTTEDVDSGLWLKRDGVVSLVAREGWHAPGTPADVSFAEFCNSQLQPTMNPNGQVAFQVGLTGVGVTAANNRGIWATDSGGILQLIARTGDLFQVAPGDLRAIASLGDLVPGGGEHGRGSCFNARGELIFRATFTDGTSGVFIASLPEPASLLLFAVAALMYSRRAEGLRLRTSNHRHRSAE